MPVSSTATLMPAPLRRLGGTLHLIRPHVAPTTSGSSSRASSVSVGRAQVLRDRLRGAHEAAQIQAVRHRTVREHEVLGLDGLDRAVVRRSPPARSCRARRTRRRRSPPRRSPETPRASASPTASSVTACSLKSRASATRSPWLLQRSPRVRGRVLLVGDDVAAGLEALVAALQRRRQQLVDRRGDALLAVALRLVPVLLGHEKASCVLRMNQACWIRCLSSPYEFDSQWFSARWERPPRRTAPHTRPRRRGRYGRGADAVEQHAAEQLSGRDCSIR